MDMRWNRRLPQHRLALCARSDVLRETQQVELGCLAKHGMASTDRVTSSPANGKCFLVAVLERRTAEKGLQLVQKVQSTRCKRWRQLAVSYVTSNALQSSHHRGNAAISRDPCRQCNRYSSAAIVCLGADDQLVLDQVMQHRSFTPWRRDTPSAMSHAQRRRTQHSE